MILFVFFALPVATILLAIVLQKILKCPILVAITFFAIYLIVAFAVYSSDLAIAIIATIIYTIIAFITAYIVHIITRIRKRINDFCENGLGRQNSRNSNQSNCDCSRNLEQSNCCCNNNENSANNLLRISCNCSNGETSDLLTVRSNCLSDNNNNDNNDNNNNCGCNNGRNQSNDVAITANFAPCSNNNGRTGFVRGCYRRM